jgi:hypothetical protein
MFLSNSVDMMKNLLALTAADLDSCLNFDKNQKEAKSAAVKGDPSKNKRL